MANNCRGRGMACSASNRVRPPSGPGAGSAGSVRPPVLTPAPPATRSLAHVRSRDWDSRMPDVAIRGTGSPAFPTKSAPTTRWAPPRASAMPGSPAGPPSTGVAGPLPRKRLRTWPPRRPVTPSTRPTAPPVTSRPSSSPPRRQRRLLRRGVRPRRRRDVPRPDRGPRPGRRRRHLLAPTEPPRPSHRGALRSLRWSPGRRYTAPGRRRTAQPRVTHLREARRPQLRPGGLRPPPRDPSDARGGIRPARRPPCTSPSPSAATPEPSRCPSSSSTPPPERAHWGELVLVAGFGGGMSVGLALVEW